MQSAVKNSSDQIRNDVATECSLKSGWVYKASVITDNMRRLLHPLWENSKNKNPVEAISLDTRKAFDKVEWTFFLMLCQNLDLVIIFVDGSKHCNQDQKLLFSLMEY